MSRFAENTSVSVERSKAEIEKTLQRYDATQFMSGWDRKAAMIGFVMDGRQVRFTLSLPDRNDDEFLYTPSRKYERDPADQIKEWEKACRQRWRALALVIKAKLEAVETGITSFEEEFLAHIALPDGRTVSQFVGPQLEEAYATGRMPDLLPWSRDRALPSGDIVESEDA